MRTFTVDEANALLPRVRALAERMVEAKRRLDAAEESRASLRARIAGNGGDIAPSDVGEAEQAVEREERRVADLVGELQGLGVLVKDPATGLVDFPSLQGGDLVLLCWRVGEDEIGYWHGPDEGFAGRKPI